MEYESYENYKESGVEWLGNIPKNWNMSKLKYIISQFVSGGTPKSSVDEYWTEKDNGIPWVAIGDMGDNFIYLNKTKNNITNKGLIDKNLQILKRGTLIYSIFASLGKVNILNIDAVTNQAILGLITTNKINNKFLFYFLKSIQNSIISISNNNTQDNLNSTLVKNIIMAFPELSVQSYLSNFLDYKIGNISLSIEKNKKLIELLKTKKISLINEIITKGLESNIKLVDSGIENIGEIPEHWKVKKLKEITEIKPSNVDKKSKKNEPEVLLCNYTDVYNNDFITNNIEFMKATASYEQIKKLSLKKGDIVITKDSETAEDIAVPTLVNEPLNNVVCGYHLALIRPLKVDSNYLFRSFECKKINDQFMLGANGVTRFGLGTYPIKNAYICYPPLEEQKEIGEYINKEVSKIDKTIEKIEIKIKLLEEYKESLIYHVVTGKINVSGEKI